MCPKVCHELIRVGTSCPTEKHCRAISLNNPLIRSRVRGQLPRSCLTHQTQLSTPQASPLILPTILRGGYYYHLCFTLEETEAKRDKAQGHRDSDSVCLITNHKPRLFLTPQMRTWNKWNLRSEVYISFLSLFYLPSQPSFSSPAPCDFASPLPNLVLLCPKLSLLFPHPHPLGQWRRGGRGGQAGMRTRLSIKYLWLKDVGERWTGWG